MLYMDVLVQFLLTIYAGFAIFKLIYMSWQYSRLESKEHMVYFVANSLGLLTALPLVMLNLYFFSQNEENYGENRFAYYNEIIARVLPLVFYIATKRNEDCFNCFNRLAPQAYSIFQFSQHEIVI